MLRSLVAAGAVSLTLATAAHAASLDCHVADPTGTPLNIRLQPNGRVAATAHNGELIQVFSGEEKVDDKGRVWYHVALRTSAAPDGYAFAAFIHCP